MYYRIMALSPDGREGYAELIRGYRLLPDGRAMVTALDSSCYFTEANKIIKDPVIIRSCAARWLFKIRLEDHHVNDI